MATILRWWMLVAALAWGGGVLAQAQQPATNPQAERQVVQPLNNAPIWRDVRSEQEHFTSTRGREAGVLIQSGGETWRVMRNSVIIPYSGWAIALALVLIAAFYLWKGRIGLHDAPTGRLIERFNRVERWTHWTVAISFSVLAISGLVMMFGRYVLLPILGPTLFAAFTLLCKNLHNFIGPVFSIAIVAMFLIYVKDNLPRLYDLRWFAKAGGFFTGTHVPSGRFNAGEKSWFWIGVVVLSTIVSVTGFILNFDNFGQTRATMQQAHVIHAISASIVMVLSLGHIYIGTLGMTGAYQSMRFGYVDESWAKEHHEYWYDDVKSGKVKAPVVAASDLPEIGSEVQRSLGVAR